MAGAGEQADTWTWTPPPPPSVTVRAAALQAAFPRYHVTVVMRWDGPRFEAVAKDDTNPWCLISADAREIWHELGASSRSHITAT